MLNSPSSFDALLQKRVYISYSQDDAKDYAEFIAQEVEKNGFDYWTQSNLKRGMPKPKSLETAIEQSFVMLAIVSKGAIESHWSRSEWYYAITYGITVIPVIIPVFSEKDPIELCTLSPIRLTDDDCEGQLLTVVQLIRDARIDYTRARAIHFVEEELPAFIALAELARQQGQPQQARELLDDVWEAAERGPYPLHHADARNVLCQIERDAGHIPAAIAAAEQAYRLAWCDGPPWAYHFGLENARRHLRELGVAEPEMGG